MPPYNGQPGVAHDGTPVVYVESLGRAVPASTAKAYGVTPRAKPTTGPNGRMDAITQDPAYRTRTANDQAVIDRKLLGAATADETKGYNEFETARGASAILDRKPPLGSAPNLRIALGRSPIGDLMGGAFGIPSKAETADLESLRSAAGGKTLGDVGLLHGPLSDKDIAFLKTMSYDPGGTPEYNRRVVEAQKWASKRKAAYGAAMRAWDAKLGSPQAVNANGQSFQNWWAGYSETKLPQPGVPASPRAAGNAALKAKSAGSGPVFEGWAN